MPVEPTGHKIPQGCLRRSDGRRELRVICSSDPFAVRAALKTTTDALHGFDVLSDDCETIELVLAEVLNNVAEHAYAESDAGSVELRVLLAEDTVTCHILDDGPPVPVHLLDHSEPPPAFLLPEGGFGWHLIHSLCRNIAYSRLKDRNMLQLEISLHRKLTLS